MGKASRKKRQLLAERLKREKAARNEVHGHGSTDSDLEENSLANEKAIFSGRFFYFSIAAAVIFALIWAALNLISNKQFSASISGADKIGFKVKLKPGDSLKKKSPLCNCPNAELSNFGFLMFYKQTTIKNLDDTSTFSITSPSQSNFTTWGTYQFRVKIALYKKPRISTIYSQDWQGDIEMIKKLPLIYETALNHLYFLSIIKKGALRVRAGSKNVITSLLPGANSKITLARRDQMYSDSLEALTLNYRGSSDLARETGDLSLEFFGPKIELIADSVVDVLGAKGPIFPLLPLTRKKSKTPFEMVAVLTIETAYKSRITMGSWGQEFQKHWEAEMARQLPKDVAWYQSLSGIPIMLFNKDGDIKFYDIEKDSTVNFYPAIYSQSKTAVDIIFEKPLNSAEFKELKARTNSKNNIFSSPNFKEGVVISKITTFKPRVPKDREEEVRSYLKSIPQDVSFENARNRVLPAWRKLEKFGLDSLPSQRNLRVPIVFYYPSLPDQYGLYYYGGLDSINLESADLSYSYGVSSNQLINNSSVQWNSLVPKIDSPYFYKLPVDLGNEKNQAVMEIKGEAEMILNDELIGTRIFDSSFIRSFSSIQALTGITFLSGLAFIWERRKRLRKIKGDKIKSPKTN